MSHVRVVTLTVLAVGALVAVMSQTLLQVRRGGGGTSCCGSPCRTTWTLAVGGALALMTPANAFAATGMLTLNGATYTNPSPGCYMGPVNSGDLIIVNRLPQIVSVFSGYSCGGQELAELMANSGASIVNSHSVYVPAVQNETSHRVEVVHGCRCGRSPTCCQNCAPPASDGLQWRTGAARAQR